MISKSRHNDDNYIASSVMTCPTFFLLLLWCHQMKRQRRIYEEFGFTLTATVYSRLKSEDKNESRQVEYFK